MATALDKLLTKKNQERTKTKYFDEKIAEYKARIKADGFCLSVKWETDVKAMNFEKLGTKTIARVLRNLPEDFEVIFLDLEKVVKAHTSSPDKFFPKKNLWKIRDQRNTARLIDFVESGNKLIPPIIRVLNNGTVIIIDGHYRIALCRYLGLRKIPFLVRKKFLKNAVALAQ